MIDTRLAPQLLRCGACSFNMGDCAGKVLLIKNWVWDKISLKLDPTNQILTLIIQ